MNNNKEKRKSILQAINTIDWKTDSSMKNRFIDDGAYYRETAGFPRDPSQSCQLFVAAGMCEYNQRTLVDWLNRGLRNNCANAITVHMSSWFNQGQYHETKDQFVEFLRYLWSNASVFQADTVTFTNVDGTNIDDTLRLSTTVMPTTTIISYYTDYNFPKKFVSAALASVSSPILFFNYIFPPRRRGARYKTLALDHDEWTLFFGEDRHLVAVHGVVVDINSLNSLLPDNMQVSFAMKAENLA